MLLKEKESGHKASVMGRGEAVVTLQILKIFWRNSYLIFHIKSHIIK